MKQETVSLKWKGFHEHLESYLGDLITEIDYSDVTLVSDEKTQFHAHKLVLSAGSPVLKNLLLNNPHSHPLIYLRGIKRRELLSILQFLYFGEARIHQDHIGMFVEITNDLKI